jgi:hypothetical protein
MWQRRSPPGREAGSGAVGHAAHRSPPLQGGGVGSHVTRGGARALPIRGRDLKPLDTWQLRSPPWLGDSIRYYKARGDA